MERGLFWVCGFGHLFHSKGSLGMNFFSTRLRSNLGGVSVALLLIVVAWLWWPRVTAGLPYVYDEDEGHHFNRVVNMVKSGDYNPHYFLKPSLHFYLRMPAVALGFLHEVQRGRARTLDDIKTGDPHGLGRHSFSASHPGVLKSVRLVSILCGLISLLLILYLSEAFTGSLESGLVASLGVACSPLFMEYAGQVGVDIVVSTVVLVAVVLATRAVAVRRGDLAASDKVAWFVFGLVCLCCGLAISTKYNAFPIALVGVLVAFQTPYPLLALGGCPVLIGLGFCLGSPFALVSLPLFLDHMAYEIWHYGLQGHEGHTRTPGWEHALNYCLELGSDGMGLWLVALGIGGLLWGVWAYGYKGLILCIFPGLYLAYMSQQKAHFLRNMVVLIPFLWCGATFLLAQLQEPRVRRLLYCLVLIAPVLSVADYRSRLVNQTESRNLLENWLPQRPDAASSSVVVSSKLQPSLALRELPGVVSMSVGQQTLEDLYMNGFRYVVFAQFEVDSNPRLAGLVPLMRFEGVGQPQRIVRNPAMAVFELESSLFEREKLEALAKLNADVSHLFQDPDSCGGTQEAANEGDLCWLKSRLGYLKGQPNQIINVELMSPWPNQRLSLGAQTCLIPTTGAWHQCELRLGASGEGFLEIGRISAPGAWHLSADTRRLGVAIRQPSEGLPRER
jgi:hypothetical protein